MAAPAGGEITVYNATDKSAQARVAVGLNYPLWGADKTDTFGSALDPVDWWYTQYGRDAPLVSGGDLLLRMFGGPPREVVISRPHWMPSDPNQAFKIAFNMTFPVADPKYPAMVTVGAVDPDFDDVLREPLRLVVPGSNDFSSAFPSADTDHIFWSSSGVSNDNFDGTQTSHLYEIEWDPTLAVNATKLRFLIDSVEKQVADVTAQPRYIAFGYAWPIRNARGTTTPGAVLGSEGTPTTVMQIHDFAVTQLSAEGHETRVWPGWTSANAGGTTIEDSAEGERFEEDGETWALIPIAQIEQIEVRRARGVSSDSFSVRLLGPDQTDPDTLPNIFAGDRMLRRPVLIDTRIGDGASSETFTAWKRQIAGVIETHDVSGGTGKVPMVAISGRDLPTYKFDTFISRAYIDGGGTIGAVEAANTGFTLELIVGDLGEVADIVAGYILGDTDRQINMAAILPAYLSSGGQSMLPFALELIDVVGDEVYRDYTISGTGRYGRLRINAWEIGQGVAGYTFSSQGASTARDGRTVLEARLMLTSRHAVGQVNYRQDGPNIDPAEFNFIQGTPGSGRYPMYPYPPHARITDQSLAWGGKWATSGLLPSKDQADANVIGGIPHLRYARENVGRRTLVLRLSGHDWLEPAVDEDALDDPDFTGITTAETWVCDAVNLTWRGGELLTEATFVTQDWIEAIRTGM